jgi:hypothetical protein
LDQDLKNLLYLGSVLLVIGVAEIHALHRWPAVHLSNTDAPLAIEMARSLAALFGTFFSALLAVIYVPASLSLGRSARLRAWQDLEERKDDAPPPTTLSDVRAWLQDHGFSEGIASRSSRLRRSSRLGSRESLADRLLSGLAAVELTGIGCSRSSRARSAP